MSKELANFFVSTEANTVSAQIANNAVSGGVVTINYKTGRAAGLAGLMGFGSLDARRNNAEGIVINQYTNGQYRPVIAEILGSGLVPAAAMPWVSANIPPQGPIPKESLVSIVKQVYMASANKTKKDGTPIVYKNQKRFAFQLCEAILSNEAPEYLQPATVVAEA